MATNTEPAVATRSISENLELIRNWINQTSGPPQNPGIMSTIRSVIFVSSPVLVIGFLGYILSQGVQSGSGDFCICPDGGVRSTISKQRLVA